MVALIYPQEGVSVRLEYRDWYDNDKEASLVAMGQAAQAAQAAGEAPERTADAGEQELLLGLGPAPCAVGALAAGRRQAPSCPAGDASPGGSCKTRQYCRK